MTTEPSATELAVTRTRLAYERTQMAWIRTATSLISFGFTIYKFFQYLRDNQPSPIHRMFGPREFAIAMIGIGMAALLVTNIEHEKQLRALAARAAQPIQRSHSGIVSWALFGLG